MKARETLQCSLQELKEQRALIEKVTARGGLDDAGRNWWWTGSEALRGVML